MTRVDVLLGQIHDLPLDSGGDAKGRVGEGQLQATRRDGILEKGEERRRDSLLSSRGGPPDSPVSIIVVVSIGVPSLLGSSKDEEEPDESCNHEDSSDGTTDDRSAQRKEQRENGRGISPESRKRKGGERSRPHPIEGEEDDAFKFETATAPVTRTETLWIC